MIKATAHLVAKVTQERGRALVLVGPPGCGKSRMAEAIATRYGSYETIDAEAFLSHFALGQALARSPATLIVEGLPEGKAAQAALKSLITNTETLAHRKMKAPVLVKSPHIIICGQTSAPEYLLSEPGNRRFTVVQVKEF